MADCRRISVPARLKSIIGFPEIMQRCIDGETIEPNFREAAFTCQCSQSRVHDWQLHNRLKDRGYVPRAGWG